MHNGIVKTLTNVRYVLDLKKNLISLDILEAFACKYTVKNSIMKVSKDTLVVMKTCWSSSLYVLQASIITNSVAISS